MPVAFILLSAWLGAGVLFATVVAPAAFAVLPSRALAGALVGRVLPVIFVSGIVAAVAGLCSIAPARAVCRALGAVHWWRLPCAVPLRSSSSVR